MLEKTRKCQKRESCICLLYTSDAADERSSVDLGGRRIIKKKKQQNSYRQRRYQITKNTYQHTAKLTYIT